VFAVDRSLYLSSTPGREQKRADLRAVEEGEGSTPPLRVVADANLARGFFEHYEALAPFSFAETRRPRAALTARRRDVILGQSAFSEPADVASLAQEGRKVAAVWFPRGQEPRRGSSAFRGAKRGWRRQELRGNAVGVRAASRRRVDAD